MCTFRIERACEMGEHFFSRAYLLMFEFPECGTVIPNDSFGGVRGSVDKKSNFFYPSIHIDR